MFPTLDVDVNLNDSVETSNSESFFKSNFLFDFEKGDFILSNGNLITLEGKESIKIWIEKIIRTEKFKFEIYEVEDNSEYGVTIKSLISGKKLPLFFLESELSRIIKEALERNEAIKRIENFELEQDLAKLKIKFDVISYTESFYQEVTL